MIGELTGDIVGSIYEFNNIKTSIFPLFRETCFFTDDTVLTVALAESLLTGLTTTNPAGAVDLFTSTIPRTLLFWPMAPDWVMTQATKAPALQIANFRISTFKMNQFCVLHLDYILLWFYFNKL